LQPLSDRQRALLGALPRQQRIAGLFGIACGVAGILYIAWAISRFDPAGDPAEGIGFDAPVTRPVATLYVEYRDSLAKREFEDYQARALARSLGYNMNFVAGLLLLSFRVILGLMVTLLGFATMTVVIERRRLIRILEASGLLPPREPSAPAAPTLAHPPLPGGTPS
jgi:hypothetical protein